MSKIDSKYDAERFVVEKQHELDAEYLLEEVLGRRRWAVKTRDVVAEKLAVVASGRPLRKRRRGPKGRHV